MTEFLLLVALLILLALIWKPLSRAVLGVLDGHAGKVRQELDEAKRLREEAQHLLAEQQRQLASGEDQARTIIEHARAEAQRQIARHHQEVEDSLRRRAEAAQARIAQEEARAIHELRAYAATLTIRTTERVLAEELDERQANALVDRAIREVGQKLV